MSASPPSVPNTQSIPVFYRVSTTNDPANKTLQIQCNSSLTFVYTTMEGGPLGVSQAPTNQFSPFIATWTLPQIPYPTTINVAVLDSTTHQTLGEDCISLFGGDVYNVRITYIPNTPAGHGYIDAMVNGNRMTVYGQNYMQMNMYEDDVWTRGSGN